MLKLLSVMLCRYRQEKLYLNIFILFQNRIGPKSLIVFVIVVGIFVQFFCMTRFMLGNYAESSPPPLNNDLKVGDSWGFDAQIIERYALQIQARKALLEYFYSLPESDRPKKPHRVCNCRRDLRPVLLYDKIYAGLSKPVVYQHIATKNTFYGGFMVCGSLYACSVCSPKIAQIRALEIRNAVSQWVKDGGICLFITLTFPHYVSDSMKSSITALKGALRRFRKGKAYDKIMGSLGFVGLIRSIETTWGQSNGSHPHAHEIWFVRPEAGFNSYLDNKFGLVGCSSDELSTELFSSLFNDFVKPALFRKWESAVVASGMSSPSYDRGMVIKVAESEEQLLIRISEYLAKTGIEKPAWGVDDELTKLHSKRGLPDRFSPFDFLRQQYNPELTKGEKYHFRCLFAEFVNSFKGTAKIYWSPGLKAKFSIQEKSDEVVAEEQTENADLVYEIPLYILNFVIGVDDRRAQLLIKIKHEGVEVAKDWLLSLLVLHDADCQSQRYK